MTYWGVVASYSSATVAELHGVPCTDVLRFGPCSGPNVSKNWSERRQEETEIQADFPKSLDLRGWPSIPRLISGTKTAILKHMKFRVIIAPDEDGVFVAECPALSGCVSQGKTREEAMANI